MFLNENCKGMKKKKKDRINWKWKRILRVSIKEGGEIKKKVFFFNCTVYSLQLSAFSEVRNFVWGKHLMLSPRITSFEYLGSRAKFQFLPYCAFFIFTLPVPYRDITHLIFTSELCYIGLVVALPIFIIHWLHWTCLYVTLHSLLLKYTFTCMVSFQNHIFISSLPTVRCLLLTFTIIFTVVLFQAKRGRMAKRRRVYKEIECKCGKKIEY